MQQIVPMSLVLMIGSLLTGSQPESTDPAKAAPPVAQPAALPQTGAQTVSDDSGILTTRSVWPVNVPLYVSVGAGRTFDSRPHILHLRAEWKGSPQIDYSFDSERGCRLPPVDMPWSDYLTLAGSGHGPCDSVAFTLKVSDPKGREPKAAPNPKSPLNLPVQIKGKIEDILTATPLADLDIALSTELNAQFYRRGWQSNGAPRLWLGTYTNCEGAKNTQYPGICHVLSKHPDVTFAVKVQVIHDSVVVAESAAWWRGTQSSVTPYEGMLAAEIKQSTKTEPDIKDGKWSLHIISNPEMALRDFASTKYWKGDVVVPVRVTDCRDWSELVAAGEAPKP